MAEQQAAKAADRERLLNLIVAVLAGLGLIVVFPGPKVYSAVVREKRREGRVGHRVDVARPRQ